MAEKEKWATQEDFFNSKPPREKMTIESLGIIWVYGLTCGEKDDYENNVVQFNRGDRQVKLQNARAALLQLTVRDQHGNRMFAEKDIGKLTALPANVADPILNMGRKLSGMVTGELEDLVKNSETAQELSNED